MKKIFLSMALLALGLVPSQSETLSNLEEVGSTNSLKPIPSDLSWEGQKEHKKWENQQAAIDQASIETANTLTDLNRDLADQLQNEVNLKTELNALQKSILDLKKIIPKDPWREIYSEKKYVNSSGSGFVRFSGQILETPSEGIRVLGQKGEFENVEFFVVNFPYPFKAGESVDPANVYVAFRDGVFSYVTEDGYAKKIPKLNYGKPCGRPQNAEAIESAALQFTPQEEAEMSPVELELNRKHGAVTSALQHIKEFTAKANSNQTKAVEKLRRDQEDALEANLEQAGKNEPVGLRRMAERYRDGDGVDKDLNKAAEYYNKADLALQDEVNRWNEKDKEKERADLKQRLLRNIDLADKNDNVESMLYLSQCYSNGIGTEVDLTLAKKYFDKAVEAGIPKLPNRALY